MSATLSDLADKYGVTKVTIKARLVAAGLWDGHARKEGNKFVVDDYAAEQFDQQLAGGDIYTKTGGAGPRMRSGYLSDSDQLINELRETVEYLKQQLAEKDALAARQLAEKDEQIARRDEQISKLIER